MQVMQAIGQVLGALGPILGPLTGQNAANPAGNAGQNPGLGLDGAALTPQGNAAALTLGNQAAPPFGQAPAGQPGAAGAGGIVDAIMQIIMAFLQLFGVNVGQPAAGNPVADPGFGNPGGAPIADPGFGNPGGAPIADPGQGQPLAAAAPAVGAAQAPGNAGDFEKGLFEQANAVRRGMGLRELKWADDLSGAARRSAAAGTHLAAPEILSFGDGAPADAINNWRGSPAHWGILTDPNLSEMGTGRAGANSAITFR